MTWLLSPLPDPGAESHYSINVRPKWKEGQITIGASLAAPSRDSVALLRGLDENTIQWRRGMTGSAQSPSASIQIARQLVERGVASANGGEPAIVGAALQRTCTRVLDSLRDSMGEDGCNALLARALQRTEPGHPLLKDLRRLSKSGIHLDGVVATLETNSLVEVKASIEALLAALVDVLGRLIGEDMAIRIIDYAGGPLSNGDRPHAP